MQEAIACRCPSPLYPFINGVRRSLAGGRERQRLADFQTTTGQDHGWETPLRFNHDGSDPERKLVQNLPVIRNSRFVGRHRILQELDNKLSVPCLEKNDISIIGHSGIGKTELALEYAYRHLNDYCSILWIDGASDPFAQMAVAATRFPTHLQPSSSRTSHEQLLGAVSAVLGRPGRHLVIIDAFDSRVGELRWSLRGERVRFLLLCQDAGPPDCQSITLSPLGDDEVLSALQKECDFDEEDIRDARELCALLAGQPAAVAKAAATLAYGIRRPADLLRGLRDTQAKMQRLGNFIRDDESSVVQTVHIEPAKATERNRMQTKNPPPISWNHDDQNGESANHRQPLNDRWSDEFLDDMRGVGDPLADSTVAALEQNGIDVWAQIRRLSALPVGHESELATPLRDYLNATAAPPGKLDDRALELASSLFERNGPMMMMLLGCYSLPAAYAAKKGVQVVFRSAKLANDTWRRTRGTAQMVIDVLHGQALHRGGRGLRTLQRVRLTHAAVRSRLRTTEPSWDPSFGTPINQEDLAGTMLTFSYTVLDGLKKMESPASPDEEAAFVYAWSVIGRMLGLSPALAPANVAEAQSLALSIDRRHFGASPEGKFMTAALVAMMKQNTPGTLFDGLAESLMFHCLGERIATMLGIERPDWTRHLVNLSRLWAGANHKLDESHSWYARLGRLFGEAFLFGLYASGPEPLTPGLVIPQELIDRWRLERWRPVV